MRRLATQCTFSLLQIGESIRGCDVFLIQVRVRAERGSSSCRLYAGFKTCSPHLPPPLKP